MATKISGKTGVTGAAGAVSGAGLAPLIIWILAQFGIEMDAATAAAAGGLITTVVTSIIAWRMPAKSGRYVDTEPWIPEEDGDEGGLIEDDFDWADGPDGGMAAYASDQTPPRDRGGLMSYALASRLERAVKNAGVKYKKVSGWESRGHGSMGSIRSVICHHTAGPESGNTPSLNVVTNGRVGLSSPLAQIFLARDGTVYLVAAGRAWHAGTVRATAYQNSHAIGIEAENTGLSNGSPWPKHQMDAYAKLCKALANEFDIPVSRVVGHKEACSPAGRKIDPTFNMNDFRGKVSGAKGGVCSDLGGSGGGRYGSPKKKHKVGSRVMGLYDGGTDITWLQKRLPKVGYPAGDVDGLFGSATERAVKAFQRANGLTADGLVGKRTLAALKAAKAPKKKKSRKSQKAPKFPLSRGHRYGVEPEEPFRVLGRRPCRHPQVAAEAARPRLVDRRRRTVQCSDEEDRPPVPGREGIGCGRTGRHQDLEGYLGGACHLI